MPFVATPSHSGEPSRSRTETLLAAIVRHYEELVSHVRQHIGRRGGDRGEARDVVHDVCVQLIEAPPAGEVRVPLAFLREVAVRRAIDRFRIEQGRRVWVDSVAELPETADDGPHGRDPAVVFDARDGVLRLVRAIESLPPRCRDVFVMHKIHELRQTEVAERLGISVKTVEKHLRLGLAACRAALADAEAAKEGARVI